MCVSEVDGSLSCYILNAAVLLVGCRIASSRNESNVASCAEGTVVLTHILSSRRKSSFIFVMAES